MKAYIKKNNLKGSLSVPGSKSHTIRAVLFGTLANGTSTIKNPLPSKDGLSSINVARLYGAKVDLHNDLWVVEGLNGKLKVPDNVIDVDNSGTTLYFAVALAALLDEWAVLTGDEQIVRRPVEKLLFALNELGVFAETTRKNFDAPPCIVKGPMKGGIAHLDGTLSQFVSALLMAAPLVDGTTRLEIKDQKEIPYVEMTLSWLRKCGIEFEYDKEDYKYYEVKGPQEYKNFDITVPADWSGVAFPLVAGVVTDSNITIENLNFDDVQGDKKIVDYMLKMGAALEIDKENGKLHVKGGKELSGTTIDLSDTPDALPALCIAAAYAKGKTTFTGTKIIRRKETDRVKVMADNLALLGVRTEYDDDTMTVYGSENIKGALVESHHDHRIAMALSVAGLICEGEMIVKDAECADVSFPTFYKVMNKLGANIDLK